MTLSRAARIVLATAMVAGCASNSEKASPTVAGSDVPSSTIVDLPFNRALFGPVGELAARVNDAIEATQQCMHERGWADYAGSSTIVQPPPTDAARRRFDAQARDYGITSTAPEQQPTTDPAEEAFFAGLTPAEVTQVDIALWEDPESEQPGCMYVGALEAFGGLQFLADNAQPMHAEVTKIKQADPDLVTLEAEWSACMATHGYQYATPNDLLGALVQRYNDISAALGHPAVEGDEGFADLRQDELDTYAADAACRLDVDYEDRRIQRETEIEQAYIDAHPERFLFPDEPH